MFNKKILIAGLVVLTVGGAVTLFNINNSKDNSNQQVSVRDELSNEEDKVDDKPQVEEKENVIEEYVPSEDEKADKPNEKEAITEEVDTKEDKSENVEEEKPVIKRTDLNNFLFIGDSFTVGIKGIISANNPNVYIHAKSSTMPSYWLDKVSEMPSNSSVEGVCLLIGVNGASRPANLVDAKELINKLLNKYPDKTIYVQKVFPVGKAFEGANPSRFNNSIKTYNEGLKAYCDKTDRVEFIDTTSGYVDDNGYLLRHNGDGLHIAYKESKDFYNNIKNEILNLTNK